MSKHLVSTPYLNLPPAQERDSWPLLKRGPARVVQLRKGTRRALWSRQGGECWYCGVETACDGSSHIEHQQPLCKGGEDALSNLVLACAPCNKSKRSLTLAEFRAKQGVNAFHGEREGA